jgi:hypothetical protein
MDIFVLRTAANWELGSGAAVVIAASLERVQDLLRDYELDDRLTIYASDAEAEADVTGPFRHAWVEVERMPTAEEKERIVIVSWDEKV